MLLLKADPLLSISDAMYVNSFMINCMFCRFKKEIVTSQKMNVLTPRHVKNC